MNLNHKPKSYNRHTRNRKEYKHNTKENHQITRDERKRRKREQKQSENNKMAVTDIIQCPIYNPLNIHFYETKCGF